MNTKNKSREPKMDALSERFGIPESGTFLHHHLLASVIEVPEKTNEYYSLVSKWRKMLKRNHGIVFRCEQGAGYRVLDDNGKVTSGIDDVFRGLRITRKGRATVQLADRSKLTEDAKNNADKIVSIVGIFEAHARVLPRALPIPDNDKRVRHPMLSEINS
jgi:hypothetical protein